MKLMLKPRGFSIKTANEQRNFPPRPPTLPPPPPLFPRIRLLMQFRETRVFFFYAMHREKYTPQPSLFLLAKKE